MENLWAPWRMAFITPKDKKSDECIFCTQPAAHRDDEYHILYRGERCYIMLNKYPYNNGHLMVAPFEHTASISQLDVSTLSELMALAQLALAALRKAMNPTVLIWVSTRVRLPVPVLLNICTSTSSLAGTVTQILCPLLQTSKLCQTFWIMCIVS